MVNVALSGRAYALSQDRQPLVADLGKASGHRDALGMRSCAPIYCDLTVLERRHIGRVASHDAGLPLGAGDDDHVDVVRHHQPVRSDELEMQVGHYYSLSSILASNVRAAASNLSRQPVLQKPTTLPRYSVRLLALTGSPDQGQTSLTQSSRRSSSAKV